MLEALIRDEKTAPKSFGYKLRNNLLTLEDQEEALTSPKWAYYFARYITGANIEVCQKAAVKDPYWAYRFAKYIPGADIEVCQEQAVKSPRLAYRFAKDIPGADVKRETC